MIKSTYSSRIARFAGLAVSIVSTCLFLLGITPAIESAEQSTPQVAPAAIAPAHFHHLHLNVTDPAANINFYTSKFDCEKGKFAGLLDGVWAQKSWMLFTKVSSPPQWELNTAIWHFGWGAEDMKATYQKQLDSGTKFFTPLTDISDIGGQAGLKDRFFYAYVEGPDHALIELNTAGHHRFGHIHMFSEDPVAAGDWYAKYFGLVRRGGTKETRIYRDVPIGPSASLMMDNVNFIIYPAAYPRKAYPDHWKNQKQLSSTKGHVVDHIGFSVDNLAESLEKLRKDGVTVTDEIKSVAGGKIKYAFIEGPDKIRIELVEGQATKE